jgi:phospholipase A1
VTPPALAPVTDSSGKLGNLPLQTQLFSGDGDSLIDYNRRRTVLGVGLSLVNQ